MTVLALLVDDWLGREEVVPLGGGRYAHVFRGAEPGDGPRQEAARGPALVDVTEAPAVLGAGEGR